MHLSDKFLTHGYFPRRDPPFGQMLESIFLTPTEANRDYPVHGPNVIRFTEALLEPDTGALGLIKGDHRELGGIYAAYWPSIMKALEVDLEADRVDDRAKVKDVLTVAALYHDIGKCIRRANHPQIGANIVRNFDDQQQKTLVEALAYPGDPDSKSKSNRFALISSIIQHHDKFGVVSTGEGALPIFSDILYFTSDQATIAGVRKNVTSVMVVNLADIAAVNTTPDKNIALLVANRIAEGRKQAGYTGQEEDADLTELQAHLTLPESTLGLNRNKLVNVLSDWKEVISAIDHERVKGNRVSLKVRLLELERNPARAIQRVLRILLEACHTSNAGAIGDYITPTSVESALVGTLGAHQFQSFCEQFATIVKLDYGLNFFKGIVCATARENLHPSRGATGKWSNLSRDEGDQLAELSGPERANIANAVTILFVKILETLVSRYAGVLDFSSSNPRRFGFQMRNLTEDDRVREAIIKFLCVEHHKDPIALTWMADEVTIWSMD